MVIMLCIWLLNVKTNPDFLPLKSVHWGTPNNLYSAFLHKGFIDCTNNLNKYYEGEMIYINLPFSDVNKWVDYAIKLKEENIVYFLCPSCTDTKWFHKLLINCDTVYFFKGRLCFSGKKYKAPFPTCIFILNSGQFNALDYGTDVDFINRYLSLVHS